MRYKVFWFCLFFFSSSSSQSHVFLKVMTSQNRVHERGSYALQHFMSWKTRGDIRVGGYAASRTPYFAFIVELGIIGEPLAHDQRRLVPPVMSPLQMAQQAITHAAKTISERLRVHHLHDYLHSVLASTCCSVCVWDDRDLQSAAPSSLWMQVPVLLTWLPFSLPETRCPVRMARMRTWWRGQVAMEGEGQARALYLS